MHIAILLDDFFPSSGGIGRSVQTQLDELTALGHEITLIAPDRNLEKPRLCRVIECPSIYVRGLPAHLNVLHCSQRRAELISRIAQFDVVHSQTERGALVLAARLARLQNTAHVHTFHANIAGTHQTVKSAILGTWSYQVLVNPLLTRASQRRTPRTRLPTREEETGGISARMDWASFADLASKVDAFTVPSPFMKELIETAARRALPGFVVPTGYNRGMKEAIDQAPREREDDRIRFLSIGRLAKEKRLDVLIKAFRAAHAPDAELVIIGDGDQRDKLRKLAAGDPRIDFRGHMRGVDAIAYELVLASYRFDSQALVITEAVAAGLPVLYCDDRLTVGLSEASALLTQPDISSLARGFEQLCDRQRLQRMSAATAELLPGLSPTTTAEKYLEVYRFAMEQKATHA